MSEIDLALPFVKTGLIRMMESEIDKLAQSFIVPGVRAIALLGSRATKTHGRFSDLDFWRLTQTEKIIGAGSHFVNDIFINVSDATASDAERWFTDPVVATDAILGVRKARIIYDPHADFIALQRRAIGFVWNDELQGGAIEYAGRQMVGWIEEAFKGLSGLERNDANRLLSARHGLSWGLTTLMRVFHGVLASGDNDILKWPMLQFGRDAEWTALQARAFGVASEKDSPTLREQVVAGLKLYILTAGIIMPSLSAEHRDKIGCAIRIINTALNEIPEV
jgi:hypothetical protein